MVQCELQADETPTSNAYLEHSEQRLVEGGQIPSILGSEVHISR